MSVVMTAAQRAVREARIAVQDAIEHVGELRARLTKAEKVKNEAERALAEAEAEFRKLGGVA